MAGFAMFFALGIYLLQQQAELPSLAWGWLPVLLCPALFFPAKTHPQRIARFTALALVAGAAGFCYAAFIAQQRLQDVLPAEWQGRDIALIGVVAELPNRHERGLSFVFDVESVETPDAHVPRHILLSTYTNERDPPPDVHAGERWHLVVRLKQPHGASNPNGFDFEEWMLEQNLRASGYVRNGSGNRRQDEMVPSFGYWIEHLREMARARFITTLGDAPYTGVLTALAVGDQGSIPAAQWQVYTRTGINHLISISGLHVTLLASLVFALVQALWRRNARLTLLLPARKAASLASFPVAMAYALLSGFSVPAQRTAYMLTVVAIGLWMGRSIALSHILAAALLVVLLADPWAVFAPGFWLSFGAVSLIFYISAHRLGKSHWLEEYGSVQWAMTVGMVPPLLIMFQQVSLVAPLANAFAIPLVSFVVVPMSLLGVVFDLPLHLAHWAMGVCVTALTWLNNLPDAVWMQHAPPPWTLAFGLAGTLWCLAPRGTPSRWLGLLLLFPMFLTAPAPPADGALRLTIFDVGQGLSISVQTRSHALLYDTGPAFSPEADSGNRILLPALRSMGVPRLDELILSHDDADHTGGAISILQGMPVDRLLSSLPETSPILAQARNAARCSDGESWQWDGVQFEILHPARDSYQISKMKDNERSCVLRISVGDRHVLLTGDIEKGSEQRLLRQHADKLPADLLTVPHHGSGTSSTQPFVDAVHPRYAVFTAGYRNRFGHPKAEVVNRYRDIGAELLRSDEDGAILVAMDAHGLSLERYRKTHRRYWHHIPP